MCFMLVHMSVPHLDVGEHRNIAIYSVFIICLSMIYLPMRVLYYGYYIFAAKW